MREREDIVVLFIKCWKVFLWSFDVDRKFCVLSGFTDARVCCNEENGWALNVAQFRMRFLWLFGQRIKTTIIRSYTKSDNTVCIYVRTWQPQYKSHKIIITQFLHRAIFYLSHDPKSTINFVLRPVPGSHQSSKMRIGQRKNISKLSNECAEISTYYHIECVNALLSGERWGPKTDERTLVDILITFTTLEMVLCRVRWSFGQFVLWRNNAEKGM